MCQIEDVDSASSLTLGYWFTILFPTHLYVHANQLFFIYKLQYFVWIMLIICVIFQLIFRSKLVKYTSRMIAVTSLPHFIAFIILESTEWMQSKPSGT